MTKTYQDGNSFRAFPNFSEPLHMLPRHGKPQSVLEWVSQKTIKSVAFFPMYVLLLVILTVVTCVWVMPLVRGIV